MAIFSNQSECRSVACQTVYISNARVNGERMDQQMLGIVALSSTYSSPLLTRQG